MKRRVKKVLEVLLAVVISVSAVGETSFAMEYTNLEAGLDEQSVSDGDMVIEDTLQNGWDDTTVQSMYDGEIANIWNADIVSGMDGEYTVRNVGWNQDIAIGGCVEFGFSGNNSVPFTD